MNATELTTGESYEDIEGNIRRIDSLEPGIVHYTATLHPRHAGKSFVCSPKYFANEYALLVAESEVSA